MLIEMCICDFCFYLAMSEKVDYIMKCFTLLFVTGPANDRKKNTLTDVHTIIVSSAGATNAQIRPDSTDNQQLKQTIIFMEGFHCTFNMTNLIRIHHIKFLLSKRIHVSPYTAHKHTNIREVKGHTYLFNVNPLNTNGFFHLV